MDGIVDGLVQPTRVHPPDNVEERADPASHRENNAGCPNLLFGLQIEAREVLSHGPDQAEPREQEASSQNQIDHPCGDCEEAREAKSGLFNAAYSKEDLSWESPCTRYPMNTDMYTAETIQMLPIHPRFSCLVYLMYV